MEEVPSDANRTEGMERGHMMQRRQTLGGHWTGLTKHEAGTIAGMPYPWLTINEVLAGQEMLETTRHVGSRCHRRRRGRGRLLLSGSSNGREQILSHPLLWRP